MPIKNELWFTDAWMDSPICHRVSYACAKILDDEGLSEDAAAIKGTAEVVFHFMCHWYYRTGGDEKISDVDIATEACVDFLEHMKHEHGMPADKEPGARAFLIKFCALVVASDA